MEYIDKIELGKINITRDDFEKEYGDGSFSYEFNYQIPGIEDGAKREVPEYSKEFAFKELVRNFAIKLRVNLYKEDESKFNDTMKLEDVINIDNINTSEDSAPISDAKVISEEQDFIYKLTY